NTWQRTVTVDQDGGRVSKVTEQWEDQAGDRVMTESAVNYDATHTLVTTYEYGDVSAAPSDVPDNRLWRQTNPDGSWVVFRYDAHDPPRIRAEIHGDQDQDTTTYSNPDVGSCHSFQFDYWEEDADYLDENDTGAICADKPRRVIEKVGSDLVGET